MNINLTISSLNNAYELYSIINMKVKSHRRHIKLGR